MNVFLNGLTKLGHRVAMAVGANGSLLTVEDNGDPGFISMEVTTVPTALAAHVASAVEILNNSGVDLVVDHGDGTAAGKLPTGNSHVFKLKSNTSELRLSVAAGSITPDLIEYWGGLQ